MIKIKCVIDDAFHFSLFQGEIDKKGLNKTNIIDLNQMYFSLNYMRENTDLVSAFFQVIALKKNMSKIYIENNLLAPLLLVIFQKIPSITEVYLEEDQTISYECVEELINNTNIQYVNGYDMTPFLMDRINLIRNVKIDLRHPIAKENLFSKVNQITTYSDAYYKRKITLTKEMLQEKEVLNDFFYANSKLKTIVIEFSDLSSFTTTLNLLKKHQQTNCLIQLKQTKENQTKVIEHFDKIKEAFHQKGFHHIKILYCEEYKQKNFLKQLNLNLLKTGCVIIVMAGLLIFALQFTKTQYDQQNRKETEEKINDIMKEYNSLLNGGLQTEVDSKEAVKTLEDLKKINSDVLGILNVPATNINYPFVKTNDNEYYLSHNIYKQANQYGWIFMDYRNQIDPLSRNLIFYGHDSGSSMFGSLRNVLNENWFYDTSNHIITLNIENEISKWQIFSVYTTPVTSDYLRTAFNSDEDFLSFATMLQERSIYSFPVTLQSTDTMLTLSTCHDEDRLVVHAVRVE